MAAKRRSTKAAPGPSGQAGHLRGVTIDPNTINQAVMGLRQASPRFMGFWTLREMARVTPPVAAIVRTRQNQVARFARLPRYEGDIGFRIGLRDPEAKPTGADKRQMRLLEDAILACGLGPDPDGLRRDGFGAWVRKVVNDSLVLDAVAVELRGDRRGGLYDWWAIDAGSIRLTVPTYQAQQGIKNVGGYGITGQGYGGVSAEAKEAIRYAQLIQGTVHAEFSAQDMAYWIRNPRTDLDANGYGYSELEVLVEVVTGFLNALLYNGRYFTHSSIPEGVLSVVGNYTQENLDDFRRHWNAMVSGVTNAWRVPILASKDGKGINWTSMKSSNRDMMFHEWMDFLLTIACAVYQIDREELGFGAKGAGEAGGLADGNNNGTLAHSMSKGLWPLMTLIESGINEDILPRLPNSEGFIFHWTGIDPDQEDQKIARLEKLLTAGILTPNEARALRDMKAIPEEALWGDAPIQSSAYQAWAMGMQAKLQAESGGSEEAAPGDEAPPSEGGPDAAGPTTLPKVNPDGTEEPDDELQ